MAEPATLDIDAAKASMAAAFRYEKKGEPDPVKVPVENKTVVTPPPEPKVAPAPPEDRSPRGLRDALEARNKRVKELEDKLAAYEPAVKERDELKGKYEKIEADFTATVKERDEFKKLQSVAALERSPEFQAKYVTGRQALATRLDQLSQMAGIAPADIAAAAARNGKERYTALDELIEQAPKSLQSKLLGTIEEIDNLDIARYEELSKADQLMQESIRERDSGDRRTREERQRIRDEAWKSTVERLGKESGLTDAELATANEFLSKNRDAGKAAEITLKGHAYDKLAARAKELEAEVKAYQDGTPGVRAGGHRSGGDANADLDKMPLSERMNELAKRAGVGAGRR